MRPPRHTYDQRQLKACLPTLKPCSIQPEAVCPWGWPKSERLLGTRYRPETLFSDCANLSRWKLNTLSSQMIGRVYLSSGAWPCTNSSLYLVCLRCMSLKFQMVIELTTRSAQLISSSSILSADARLLALRIVQILISHRTPSILALT